MRISSSTPSDSRCVTPTNGCSSCSGAARSRSRGGGRRRSSGPPSPGLEPRGVRAHARGDGLHVPAEGSLGDPLPHQVRASSTVMAAVYRPQLCLWPCAHVCCGHVALSLSASHRLRPLATPASPMPSLRHAPRSRHRRAPPPRPHRPDRPPGPAALGALRPRRRRPRPCPAPTEPLSRADVAVPRAAALSTTTPTSRSARA